MHPVFVASGSWSITQSRWDDHVTGKLQLQRLRRSIAGLMLATTLNKVTS